MSCPCPVTLANALFSLHPWAWQQATSFQHQVSIAKVSGEKHGSGAWGFMAQPTHHRQVCFLTNYGKQPRSLAECLDIPSKSPQMGSQPLMLLVGNLTLPGGSWPMWPCARWHIAFVHMAFCLETGTINKEGKSQENLAPMISIPSNTYLACTFCFSCRTQAICGFGRPYKWRYSFLILLLSINPQRETGRRQPDNPFPQLSTF